MAEDAPASHLDEDDDDDDGTNEEWMFGYAREEVLDDDGMWEDVDDNMYDNAGNGEGIPGDDDDDDGREGRYAML